MHLPVHGHDPDTYSSLVDSYPLVVVRLGEVVVDDFARACLQVAHDHDHTLYSYHSERKICVRLVRGWVCAVLAGCKDGKNRLHQSHAGNYKLLVTWSANDGAVRKSRFGTNLPCCGCWWLGHHSGRSDQDLDRDFAVVIETAIEISANFAL